MIDKPLYNYQCGNNLFGFKDNRVHHPKSTDIFHIGNNLTCYMSMEKLYFQGNSYVICPGVCSVCGLGDEFINGNIISDKAEGVEYYPICL